MDGNIGMEYWKLVYWNSTLEYNAWYYWNIGEGTLPWTIFRFRIFSNYFSQKFEKIKITVWKTDNYVWKFSFRIVIILLHIKSASKKIWHLAQGRVFDPCFGPYICIPIINTKLKIFSPFNKLCLFIKWKVEARTKLFMQNYLFNFVIQGNLSMICTLLFLQKNKLLFTIKL